MTSEQASAPVLVLQGVSLKYRGNVRALSSVSLQAWSKQHIAIMGPSGSGKTSLLGCISGRIDATSGSITRTGRVATIHQDLRLVGQKTALQNVLHGAIGRHSLLQTLVRFPENERKLAKELLCRVGLCDRAHTRVRRLSGGEKQRVAIARALMQNPSILLADEPVAALDEQNAVSIMQLLNDLAAERNLTIISVLHDFSLAKAYADRIVRLVDGRVAYDAPNEYRTALVESFKPSVDEYEQEEQNSPESAVEGPRAVSEPPTLLASWKFFFCVIAAVCIYAWAVSGLRIGARDFEGMLGGLAGFLGGLLPKSVQELRDIPWGTLSSSLVETLQMALVGTTLGVLISWPLAALAANNVGPKFLRPGVRFFLNVVRTVPSLIWALLFVAAVGLGPFAGVLALAAYSIGYLTKFFYESFESVDPGPPDALKEIGACGPERFFHAVWPAALPSVLSSSFFMLEYNVRAASVLGIVDAGGIGFYIKQYVDYRMFPAVTASLLMLLVLVVFLDSLSTWIRKRLMRP